MLRTNASMFAYEIVETSRSTERVKFHSLRCPAGSALFFLDESNDIEAFADNSHVEPPQ